MIAIGCDHGGINLKNAIIEYFNNNNITYKDFGCADNEAVDYPKYGQLVANAVASGEHDKGIVICGTGIGISISANKIKGIRCALAHDCFSARMTREHNDANMLALGERVIGAGLAVQIVEEFLNTNFSGDERHSRRISMIE